MRTGKNTCDKEAGFENPDRRATRFAPAALFAVALVVNAAYAQNRSLMSNTWNGAQTDGHSDLMSGASVSNGGRYVAFASDATNLVQGDLNGVRDIFVYDRSAGTTILVSIDSTGGQADLASSPIGAPAGASISRFGRFVAFTSAATNLVGSDNNGQPDVFIHDRDLDGNLVFDESFNGAFVTLRVSVDSAGNEASGGPSQMPVVSSDGRFVAFVSAATNLIASDNNGRDDVFVHDRDADCNGIFDETFNGAVSTVRVSVSTSGGDARGDSTRPSISSNGRFVVFDSVAGDIVQPDANGGFDDVFVYDRDLDGDGRFDETGPGETGTVFVSLSTSGVQGNAHSTVAYGGAISETGRHIVFASRSDNLIPGGDANGGLPDVFVRDRDLDGNGIFDETFPGATSTVVVSVSSAGVQGNWGSFDGTISADGRYVMFQSSSDNLDPNTPGFQQNHVFWHDRDADGNGIYDETFNGAISTIWIADTQNWSPPPNAHPIGAAIDPLGGTIAYSTDRQHVPGDTNAFYDVYAADIALDSDGDGLLDTWETNGIDADGDGNVDLMLPGADPNRKTIYVEIDGMAGRVPTVATLNAVVQSFANAPTRNPDGTTGIDLILIRDEINEPLVQWPFSWTPFVNFKNARFGTAAQRAGGNWANIRAAKLMAHHYCVFADRFTGNTVSGLAEAPGNDFFITLGGWNTVGGTAQQQQGLFMHELGHNLDLGHGGRFTDPVNGWVNYKPNYLSVMNYTWTVPALVPTSNPYAQFWTLDFSQAEWPCLDELCLNEPAGIGGRANALVPAGPPNGPFARLVREAGPVDWNLDRTINGACIAANANQLPNVNPNSPAGQLLRGHDDWTNLWLPLRGHFNFGNGVSGFSDAGGEITLEEVEALTLIGDCNGNGIWDEEEIDNGQAQDSNNNRIPDECEESDCEQPFSESFDAYPDGTQLHGVNGWKGWDNDPAFSAPVTQDQSSSAPHSLDIFVDADLVHEYCTLGEGVYSVAAWQYIPSDFASGGAGQFDGSYFVVLNTYADGQHDSSDWSVQIQFDSNDGMMKVFHGDGVNTINVPYETDRWVKIQAVIDLDNDWTQIYYDENLVTEYTWTGGVLGEGGGALDIGAIDFFANGSSSIYYDDLLIEVIPPCDLPFLDDLESYPPGSQLHGQNGWKGWDNDPAFSAPVTQERASSGVQSVDIFGAADLVHEHCTEGAGVWSFSAKQFVPFDFFGPGGGTFEGHFLNLLNTYNDGGPYDWSVAIKLDSDTGMLKAFHGEGLDFVQVPYVSDRWVNIQVIVDLDSDWTQIYYDDALITEYTWTGGIFGDGGGALDIAAVDFFANNTTSVYYDDIVFEQLEDCDPCDANCDGEVNAFDIEPFLDLLFGGGDPCAPCTGDANGDGNVDAFDIEPFLNCLFP